MSKEKALSTFRQDPYRYNCAQTIVAAFGREDLVNEMSACGGGRAPDGMCGALYGAITVAPDKRDLFIRLYRDKLGAIHCKELKQRCAASCQECVSTASDLIIEHTPS